MCRVNSEDIDQRHDAALRGYVDHEVRSFSVECLTVCKQFMACFFQAYFLVAPTFAAAWISSNTWKGWETIDAWLEGTEMVVAFIRLANICWVAGGMMRSSVEIRYHDGRVFHATAVVGSVKWTTLPGFCTVAMMFA